MSEEDVNIILDMEGVLSEDPDPKQCVTDIREFCAKNNLRAKFFIGSNNKKENIQIFLRLMRMAGEVSDVRDSKLEGLTVMIDDNYEAGAIKVANALGIAIPQDKEDRDEMIRKIAVRYVVRCPSVYEMPREKRIVIGGRECLRVLDRMKIGEVLGCVEEQRKIREMEKSRGLGEVGERFFPDEKYAVCGELRQVLQEKV